MIESSIAMFNSHTPSNQDISDALLRLTSRKTDVIIVVARSFHLPAILSEGKQLGLLGTGFYWIFICDDLIPADAVKIFSSHAESNILLIRHAWSGTRACNDGHCDLEHCLKDTVCGEVCPYMTQLEATLTDAVSVIAQSSWSFSSPVSVHEPVNPRSTDGVNPSDTPRRSADEQPVVSCLANGNLTISHGDSIIDEMRRAQVTGYTLSGGFKSEGIPDTLHFEIFSLKNSTKDTLQLVATWSPQDGLITVNENRLFLNKFYDFGGRVLTIATLESKPFSLPTTVNNVTTYRGFAFDILNELTVRLNFSYRIVEPPDRLYGAPNPDGSWNGMVGMVKRGEIDMAVGPFTITSIRESVIDFTKPYLEDSSGILTRKPQEEDSQIFQMFKPYSGEVWGAIAAATFFVGIISYLVNYYTPYSGIRQGLRESTSDEIDFKENLWLIYSSAMEQGATYHPNATSGRLVLGFFWIFTIVVVATYTANLAAFLTVAVPFTPINSLGELLAQTEVQPVVKDGTNLWAMFQSSKRGIYQEVWSRLQQSPRATVTEDALKLVEQGQYAYISDNALLQYIALSGCKFAVANEVFNTAGYGFVMPENAPFQDAVNYNIMKMQEAGLIEKWRQKWWSSDGTKCSSEDRTGSATSLSLSNLGGAFLVYLIVAGVSVVCLTVEVIGKSTGLLEKLRRKFHRPLKTKVNGFHQNGLS